MTQTNLPREALPIINAPHALTTDRACILLGMLAWKHNHEDHLYQVLTGLIDAMYCRYCGTRDLRDGFMLRTKCSIICTREASCYLIDHQSVAHDLTDIFHHYGADISERTAHALAYTLSEYAIAVDVDYVLTNNDNRLPLSCTLPTFNCYGHETTFEMMAISSLLSSAKIRKYTNDAAAEVWLVYSLPQTITTNPVTHQWYNTWCKLHDALYSRVGEFTNIVPNTSPEDIIAKMAICQANDAQVKYNYRLLRSDIRRIPEPYIGLMLDPDGYPIYHDGTKTHRVLLECDQYLPEPTEYWYEE